MYGITASIFLQFSREFYSSLNTEISTSKNFNHPLLKFLIVILLHQQAPIICSSRNQLTVSCDHHGAHLMIFVEWDSSARRVAILSGYLQIFFGIFSGTRCRLFLRSCDCSVFWTFCHEHHCSLNL